MKTLYLDCGMGAAGDMLTAALLDLLTASEQNSFVKKMNSLELPGLLFSANKAEKCCITGCHVSVMINNTEEESVDVSVMGEDAHSHHHEHNHSHAHDHHHHSYSHTSIADIKGIVEKLPVSEKVKGDVLAVYSIIAEAEGHVHGKPMEHIHFHEVGTLDAIADVTAVCLLMEQLGAEQIVASPVHVGAGKARCSHGILPVPTPATAHILKGIPIYGGRINAELCTPTGAALLKYFVNSFGNMPVMSVESIGYGMGNKDFEIANCVRVMLGNTVDTVLNASSAEDDKDTVIELDCNVDDMTAEEIGFAMEQLFDGGAADVFVIPVTMKKSRPGHLIAVICRPELKSKMVELIMKHTSTIGIREKRCKRNVLERRIETVESEFGPVRKKVSTGYGITREKFEFDDIARIARENNMSYRETVKRINK